MNKASLNLLIDLAAGALLTALVATGYLLWFVLPPGADRTHDLLGWQRHEWGSMHAWIAGVLLLVLAVHLTLHWRWLSLGLCRRFGLGALVDKRPARAAMIALLITASPLVAFMAAAHLFSQSTDAPRGEHASPSVDAGGDSSVELEQSVASMLRQRCAECHGAEHAANGVRADTPAWLLIEQHGTRWVLPGDAAGSPILRVLRPAPVDGDRPRPHQVPQTEIDALRRWVLTLAAPGAAAARGGVESR